MWGYHVIDTLYRVTLGMEYIVVIQHFYGRLP